MDSTRIVTATNASLFVTKDTDDEIYLTVSQANVSVEVALDEKAIRELREAFDEME